MNGTGDPGGSMESSKLDTIVINTAEENLIYQELLKERVLTKSLTKQIEELNERLKTLEQILNPAKETNSSVESNEIYTSEDTPLVNETEWIVKKARNQKKRKAVSSPEVSPSQPVVKLAATEISTEKPIKEKHFPPPPITVKKCNYDVLHTVLRREKCDFSAKLLSSGEIKLNAPNGEAYRNIVKAIKTTDFAWHTYEDKQTRPIRVMAKKLPGSCKPESIIEDLKTNQRLKIESAVNILDRKDKSRLPIFMLSFSHDEEIDKIYGIKQILGVKVQIERQRGSKLIPQCKRCQRHGHTQKYCRRDPKCVKCAGDHLTVECLNVKLAKPTCTNCGENHPASYRGCIVAKEMQKLRRNEEKRKKPPPSSGFLRVSGNENNKLAPNSPPAQKVLFQPTIAQSFAQVVKKKTPENSSGSLEQTMHLLLEKMGAIDGKIETLSNKVALLESGNRVASYSDQRNV